MTCINAGTMYTELSGLLVQGENIKSNKQRREWNAVLTGKLREGNNGTQCHVIDLNIQAENKVRKANGERTQNAKRWLALWSFTGKIGNTHITEGRRADGNGPIFNV